MIAIIDYKAGNLQSVQNAFDYIGVKSKKVSSVAELDNVDKLVLPGVGAFGAAIQRLQGTGFYEFIKQWILADKPFFGICLGMQLLFENSSESSEDMKGINIFKGKCLRFNQGKIPQIGWNQVKILKESKLLKGIKDGSFFYFLHSYYIVPQEPEIITATTNYAIEYPSIIEKGNLFAIQFHPEKSGGVGLKLLKNWVNLC